MRDTSFWKYLTFAFAAILLPIVGFLSSQVWACSTENAANKERVDSIQKSLDEIKSSIAEVKKEVGETYKEANGTRLLIEKHMVTSNAHPGNLGP